MNRPVILLAAFAACSAFAGIQRTMKRMEESTVENPATVRVLFYGQSIVQQRDWNNVIINRWKEQYPSVNFVVENKAIGGFGTDSLARCMDSDIFPFYPDLLFFHDYGDVEGGYGHILGEVRRRTTTEIILWSSHLRFDEDPKMILDLRDGVVTNNDRWNPNVMAVNRTKGIRSVAEDLETEYVDLQKKWCEMLIASNLTSKALIYDTVHLNADGKPLYGKMLGEELVRKPGEDGEGVGSGVVMRPKFADVAKINAAGDIEVAFDGNRIVAVSNGEGYDAGTKANVGFEVLIDGIPVADISSQWYHTRSTPIIRWFPGCCTPEKGPSKLQEEDWALTVDSYVTNSGPKYITYHLEGSKTGPDGEGTSTNRFVSKSGRVVIDGLRFSATVNPWKCAGPVPGDQIKWQSKLVPVQRYVRAPKGTETVLAQELDNGPHVLTIKGAKDNPGIGSFIINKPDPKWVREPNEKVIQFRKKQVPFFYGDKAWK